MNQELPDEMEENQLQDRIRNLSLIAGAVFIVLGLILFQFVGASVGGGLFILGLITLVLPLTLLSFLKSRQIKEMEQQFPAFLKGLAESKRGGMTLLNAFESAKNTDYGRLNSEVERVYHELSWGIPFPKVMERFSERVSESPVMQQSLSIIIQSFESGGDITHTIESVADEATKLRSIVEKKNSQLNQQLIIMYIIYFLFIGITIGLYVMLDQLLGLGTSGGAISNLGRIASGSGQSIHYCSDDIVAAQPFCTIAEVFGFIPDGIEYGTEAAKSKSYEKMAYYKSLLFTILMIQGISTSAVAGKISEGEATAGVKHALVMVPVAFIIFMLVIAPSGV